MSEYFETEEVVKGYDRVIVGRILSYLKPYRLLAGIMMLSLAVSTLGELFVPVIQQRLIDDAILARFLVIRKSRAEEEDAGLDREVRQGLAGLLDAPRITVEDYVFIPQSQNIRISRRTEEALRSRGILDGEQWYAFPLEGGAALTAVLDAHPSLFIRDEKNAAIRNRDLYSLSVPEIRMVRSRDLSRIIRAVVFLLAVLALVFLFTFVQTWITTLIGQRVMKDIRLALFNKTASQSTDFLSRHPVGRLVTRLTGDVETINEFFTSVLVAFLKDLSVMAGVLITLFLLSPKLAAVVLCTMPPVLVVTAVSRIKARDAFRRQRTASSRVNSYLSERLSGIQVVQLFLREKRSSREFEERNAELLDANLGEMYVFAIFRPIIEWLSTLPWRLLSLWGAAWSSPSPFPWGF
jgi:ATP-binding cassette subfamily B protein